MSYPTLNLGVHARTPIEELPVYDIPFLSGLMPNVTQLTIIVGPIPFPFRVLSVSTTNIPTAFFYVRHWFFVSSNATGSITRLPIGDNVFGAFGSDKYLESDLDQLPIIVNFDVKERGRYLKVHFYNESGAGRNSQVSMTIQELPEEEKGEIA